MKKQNKFLTTISFEHEYHRDLFEDWMSNLGEQLFDQQLDVEKENSEVPAELLEVELVFDYPQKGNIAVKGIK